MRNGLILIAGLLLAAGQVAAGQCTDELAWQKPGAWSRADDNLANDRALPQSAHAAALQKADEVVELVKRAIPDPMGVQAKVSRSRGLQHTGEGPLKYGVTAFFLGYFCVGQTAGNQDTRGKVLLGDETATWIYIKFNDLSQLISPLSNEFRVADGGVMFSLPRRSGDFKGHAQYAWESSHGVRWEAILVKAKDMRLTRDVSREEFIRTREQIERDQIATLLKSADGRPASARASIDKSVKSYEQRVANLVALRESMSPAERQEPAIVRNTHTGNRDHITFAAKGERGGERLYVLSSDFFDKSLPRHAIQFATILLRWEPQNPPKVEAMRQFRENFDIEALRALLGRS